MWMDDPWLWWIDNRSGCGGDGCWWWAEIGGGQWGYQLVSRLVFWEERYRGPPRSDSWRDTEQSLWLWYRWWARDSRKIRASQSQSQSAHSDESLIGKALLDRRLKKADLKGDLDPWLLARRNLLEALEVVKKPLKRCQLTRVSESVPQRQISKLWQPVKWRWRQRKAEDAPQLGERLFEPPPEPKRGVRVGGL